MSTNNPRRSVWIHVAEFATCYALVLIPMLLTASNVADGDEFYKSLAGALPKLLDLLREMRQA